MSATTFPARPGTAWPGQITPGDPGVGSSPSVLNQWSSTLLNDPGLALVPVANSDGNALVAYVGWNDRTFPQIATVSVTDDAHNYWQPLVANAQSTFGVRGAIWIATKADPAKTVCVSASLPVSGLCVTVVEFPNMPQLVQLDFSNTSGNSIVNTSTVSGTATTTDWAFGLAVTSNNTDTITPPGAGWTALTPVSINDGGGAGGLADTMITPVYQQVTAGAVSATWTSSGTLGIATTLAGITVTSPTVTNPGNPQFPLFQVQAAFGAQVGNGQTPYTWTDITSRAYYDDGSTILDYEPGRPYELSSPTAGTIQLWLNNQDGALTPTNSASPYYPNVLPQTPIRVIATWNNEVYPVASGYVDKWPQDFPMPQWGMVNMQASDGMGVLANLSLYSALQSEILQDGPYAYYPFGESYGEANGLPFANLGNAVSNTKPMVGLDGQANIAAPLATGLTLNLQGDQGSGVGVSGLTANPNSVAGGVICVDPGLPQLNANLSLEFAASLPTTPPTGGAYTTPLVSLLGSPTNFGSGGGPVRFQVAGVYLNTTTITMQVVLADFLGNTFTTSAFTCPNDGNTHHHVFTVTFSGGTWTIAHYRDGALDTQVTNVTVTITPDVYAVVAGPAIVSPIASNPYNYTLAHLAIYPKVLALPRIQSHYNAGWLGFANESAMIRFKRIIAWSQTHVPMAATPASAAPLMGAAFSTAGQAPTDAFNDLLLSEGGFPYTDASGFTWWASRASFYNGSPKWTFGDNPANGEIPYDPGTNFDFDNAYLYTQVLATRQIGQTTQITTNTTQGASAQTFLNEGAIVRVASAAAGSSYGNRNALQQNILTSTDQDAYDRAFWSLQKYSASSLRIPQILVDAASNANLWPVVLGVEQGDVVKVIRRPLGGAAYAIMGIVVQKHLEIGVNKGQVTLGVVPYNIEANIVQVDNPNFNTLANGIGW